MKFTPTRFHSTLYPCLLLVVISTTAGCSLMNPRASAPLAFPEYMSIRQYPITGNSPCEWKQAMNKSGPTDQFGIRRWALTTWSVSWKGYKKYKGKVLVESIKFSPKLEVFLPELLHKKSLPRDTQETWDSLSRSIWIHEQRHISSFKRGLDLLKGIIQKEYPNTKTISTRTMRKTLHSIIQKMQQRDIQIDTHTQHGVKDGVSLPKSCQRQSEIEKV